ncbi:MAG: hypothetical protein QOD30_533, partial [Actinomycetota bacterium]|nr:hypothetical protein [Actinomycetota bacterium]
MLDAPGATAAGGVSIAVADAPTAPADPRAAFYIVDAVRPGGTVERRLRVRNDDVAAAHVALYLGGATVRDGALQFDDHAAPAAPIARWATVAPTDVTLDPGASTEVAVKIHVPEEATEGEQLGVVWAETRLAGANGESVNRVGVRIYLVVAERPPASDLELVSITPRRDAAGGAQVDLAVRNTGGREVEPAGEVVLADRSGATTPLAPGLALLPDGRGVLHAAFAAPVAADPTRVEVRVRANGV